MTTQAGVSPRPEILEQIRAAQRRSRLSFRLWFALTWIGLVGGLVFTLWATGNIDLSFIAEWGPFILGGAGITILLCVTSIVFATILAVFGAIARLSANPVINGVASLYVSLVRGTPLIVQITSCSLRCRSSTSGSRPSPPASWRCRSTTART